MVFANRNRNYEYNDLQWIGDCNKKVDFDVDFDDEQALPKVERSIAKKDSIKNLIVNGLKV